MSVSTGDSARLGRALRANPRVAVSPAPGCQWRASDRQLLLPFALAGAGSFTAQKINMHARTNMTAISMFLPVRFDLRPGFCLASHFHTHETIFLARDAIVVPDGILASNDFDATILGETGPSQTYPGQLRLLTSAKSRELNPQGMM